MRRRLPALVLTALLASTLTPLSAVATAQEPDPGPDVVISQVYGGGGNSGATYTHDFIELFNAGDAVADLAGWSVQYASANGSSWQVTPLADSTLEPGQYLYVQQAAGAGGTVTIDDPDVVGTIPMAGTNGKVALVASETSLTGSCPLGSTEDFVGFGSANCFEGSGATPVLSNTTAAHRADGGCVDTDDNAADFSVGAPSPRTSRSPVDPCAGGGVNTPVVATCPDLAFDAGQDGTTQVSARDRDGTVTSAAITAGDERITLTDIDPADEIGGTLTATVTAPADLEVGDYPISITFTNDDDDAQSGDCTLTITVRPNPCDTPRPIHTINTVGGDGLPAANDAGQRVAVQAVVTAAFPGLSGFYVQEEDEDADDDPTTSEGIFVYTPALGDLPEPGTLVCAVGTIAMFSGASQLTNVTVTTLDVDQPLPTAVELQLPVEDRVEISHIAGMRVELTGEDGTMTVAQNYFQGQYGELDLSATGRQWNPTELYRPDDPRAAELRAENLRAQIKLDDANSSQNRRPIPWLANGADRAGAETDDVIEGIAAYQFNAYRIQPTNADEITFTNTANPRPDGPPDVLADADREDQVTVAAFNVLNYFTTLTSESSDARGADTTEEFELQAAKIVTAITEMDADVVGLMEIENNFGADDDAALDLVERLNEVAGEGTYAAIELDEPVGTDAISNAMIYQPASVTPVGDPALADHDEFVNPLGAAIDRNRPAVTQAFEVDSGEVFVATVNHLKSKGSACAEDPATTLAGNCNRVRELAAQELVRWLDEDDPTDTGSANVIILGDLNSYAMEDPIEVLRDAGYVDALGDQLGEAYTYVFDSELGRLDHGFVSAPLADHLVDAATWSINADEPNAFDYNDWNDPATQDTSEFRSSDHDPVIIGLQFGDVIPPPNVPPTVEDLALTTTQDTPVDGQLTISDPDGDDDALIVTYDQPDDGTVVGGDDGSFTYTPDTGFHGTDAFTVTVTDERGGSATATVTITVERRVVDEPDEPLECPPGSGSGFPDVPAASVHADNIRCGDALELFRGNTDGRFQPDRTLTRGQAASVIDRIATATGRPLDGTRRSFSDVPAGYAHADAIERLAAAGVINGYVDGTFRPGVPVTRGQLASLLVRYIETVRGESLPLGEPFPDVAADSELGLVLRKARAAGIFNGTDAGEAQPQRSIRRDQAASLFVRSLELLPVAR